MLDPTIPLTRRRWLQSATLLTLSTALAARSFSKWNSSQALAAANAVPNPAHPSSRHPVPAHQVPAHPIPTESLVTQPTIPQLDSPASEPLSYQQFLALFPLRHIKPHEIINPHRQTTQGVSNTLPPSELWPAMPATLFVADEIRARLGQPLKLITSAYRSPSYNQACGGAPHSWHTKNNALDLAYAGGPRAAYAIARQLRDEGYFQGGIGLYKTFLHLDTRGTNATWRG